MNDLPAGLDKDHAPERCMSELTELLSRLWTDLIARPEGPFGFRLLLQPLVAALLAVRDGVVDARAGHSPYFWTLLHDPGRRRERLREGVKATLRVVLLGVVIDAVYQFKVHGNVYPGEALGIALLLGFVPYLLIRGPVDRIARRRQGGSHGEADQAQHPGHLG
jgi:hypothetical protein